MFSLEFFLDELRAIPPLSLDTALLSAKIERERSFCKEDEKREYMNRLNKPRFERRVAESKLRKG